MAVVECVKCSSSYTPCLGPFWTAQQFHIFLNCEHTSQTQEIKTVFQKYDKCYPTKYSMEDCVKESQPTIQSCRLMLPKRPQTSKIILVPLTYSVIKEISVLSCPLESKTVCLISTGIQWGEYCLSRKILSPGTWYILMLTLCNRPG